MFIIYGTYKGVMEQIDVAETEHDANYLVAEYRMAYGDEWLIHYAKEGKNV